MEEARGKQAASVLLFCVRVVPGRNCLTFELRVHVLKTMTKINSTHGII